MGGMIAQELVLNHPDAVQGLVLGCTYCGPAHSVPVPMETVSRVGQITGLTVEERIAEFWKLTVTEPFIASGKEFLDGIIQVHLDTPTPWATFGLQFAAVQQFDTFDRLPGVKAPTLIIHGDKDILIPYGNADILHKQIPGSRLHTVNDVGHCFFWEKPEESAAVVSEFLASVPAPV
jgi:pimeloyl-ACP methyl ester carboxylesterase